MLARMASELPIGEGWTQALAKDGTFSGGAFRGGWARFTLDEPVARTVFLEAQGDSFAYVNGEPRAGDVYSTGYVSLPVRLRKGANELLFRVGRGSLKVALAPVERAVSLDARDATLPDRVAGRGGELLGALVVRNAREGALRGLSIEATSGGRRVVTKVGPVMGLGVRKAGFAIPGGKDPKVTVRLLEGGKELDRTVLTLRGRKAGETQRRTFQSGIDGSVQYWALNPATSASSPALVLSLHGASVEAQGQAEAYGAKAWASVVCPTNRRPFGYDWEDWGRTDALEVLAIAEREIAHDPSRVYLTGHSMGGHGAWRLGVLDPDRFGAVAPSAGWASSFGYAGALRPESVPGAGPVEAILARAGATGDTEAMLTNLDGLGVTILHGDADDNVPVSEARRMAGLLGAFHHDFQLIEAPGQNHWWDLNDEPGADAVDDARIWDSLQRHARPVAAGLRFVRFVTPDPGTSASRGWATLEQQERAGELSRVDLRLDPERRRIVGTTANLARLTLDPPLVKGGLHVELDGTVLDAPSLPAHLERVGSVWRVAAAVPAGEKTPARGGRVRSAFGNRFMLVYGTGGSAREREWARAKARYDAETWWVRGNGECDVVPDMEFDPVKDRDRSVIVYGRADTNRAWGSLLGSSPVSVASGRVTVGGKVLAGEDLAVAFVRPRPGSAVASVGVVGATGAAGEIMANEMPLLQPMLGFPDVFVVSSEGLASGLKGVRGAGFFGNDWSVERGEIAYRP